MENKIEIFKSFDNQIEIEVKLDNETVWLNRQQIALLFDRDVKTIGKHINNVFNEGELDRILVVANFATTSKHGAIEGKTQTTKVEHYNLDVIISVGYRVKSLRGVQFRQWATQRLKEYIVKGYAINQNRIEKNKLQFLQTLNDLKLLTQSSSNIEAKDIISLIQSFSNTFFVLDSYDKNEFPKHGEEREIKANAQELQEDLQRLKLELIKKGEATELFAQEKKQGDLEGIFGNVFQSILGQDAYPTVEEKVAHLLYFIIKNHPFNDGNKRSGAFSFIWLLQKAGYSFQEKISPETLTTLTLLIAESNPADKEKMVGIVKLLLNSKGIKRS